jgi:hypothetical protein
MFDYPLPIPRNTSYQLLDVDPEATAEEISAAQTSIVGALKKEQDAVNRNLKAVYESVPGLEKAYKAVEGLLAKGKQADPAELRRAQVNLAKLEQKAKKIAPGFQELRERFQELGEKIHNINNLGLHDPSIRLAYDMRTPPLSLFKLADCGQAWFKDNTNILYLLRRELSEFITAKGEVVFHPSDLTRQDFSGDFSFNPILDGDGIDR